MATPSLKFYTNDIEIQSSIASGVFLFCAAPLHKKYGALAPLSPKKQMYHFLEKNEVKIGKTLYFLKNVEIFLKTRHFHKNSRGASLHDVKNTLSKDVTRTKKFPSRKFAAPQNLAPHGAAVVAVVENTPLSRANKRNATAKQMNEMYNVQRKFARAPSGLKCCLCGHVIDRNYNRMARSSVTIYKIQCTFRNTLVVEIIKPCIY